MAEYQQYVLRWDNHQTTLISIFDSLLNKESLVDCTLAADGESIKVHRIVLSACSSYFETLLDQHYDKHPIIVLKDVTSLNLRAMVDYMYRGEVNVSVDKLASFLVTAKSLKIKGLFENVENENSMVEDRSQNHSENSFFENIAEMQLQTKTNLPQNVQSKRTSSQTNFDSNVSLSGSKPSTVGKRRRIQKNASAVGPCVPAAEIQSTSLVTKEVPTTVPVATPDVIMPSLILRKITVPLNSTVVPETGQLEPKIEPSTDLFLLRRTENIDDDDDIIEGLTLDDEFNMEAGRSCGDDSNQSKRCQKENTKRQKSKRKY